MENTGEDNRPNFFFGHVDISRDSDEQDKLVHAQKRTRQRLESFSYDCHVRGLRFIPKKRRKDLFLLPRFFFYFVSFFVLFI